MKWQQDAVGGEMGARTAASAGGSREDEECVGLSDACRQREEAGPTLAVTPWRSRVVFLWASQRNAMKCETSAIVNLVFPSIVVFLKNSFNVVSLSPSHSLSIFSGREASLLFNFTLQTRPSSAVTAKSVFFFLT